MSALIFTCRSFVIEGFQSKPRHISLLSQLATSVKYISDDAGPKPNNTPCTVKDRSRISAAYCGQDDPWRSMCGCVFQRRCDGDDRQEGSCQCMAETITSISPFFIFICILISWLLQASNKDDINSWYIHNIWHRQLDDTVVFAMCFF